MTNIVWQGTVDNLELSGIRGGDEQPMRIVEDSEGRLTTEFAADKFADESQTAIEYDESTWIADYQRRFCNMRPAIPKHLRQRMIAQTLLDA